MAKTILLNINPDVLKWAREEAGYKDKEIASKIGVKLDRYQTWEKTGQNIPLGYLKEISKQCKRQLAVYFLHESPPKEKLPNDFRNLNLREKELSTEIRLSIRRTHRYQDLALDLKGEDYWKKGFSWLSRVRDMIKGNGELVNDQLLKWLRERLKIDIIDQKRFRTPRIAFNNWRNVVESELGIFVFQFSMPMEEIQGFSISDRIPNAIVINKNHAYTGKIFSIFHELAHIFKRESGICDQGWTNDELKKELKCNEFSAKFLVPDEHVYSVSNLEELKNYAKTFNISKDVYLRRIFGLGFISRRTFFELLEEIKKQPHRKKGGPVKPTVKSRSSRGEMFYNLVIDAVNKNKIDFNTASDALGLAYRYLINV